ncbi:hypothetical protein N7451_011855 [Penicillium sp. IBT 35674x]|nr:hypothetical protein N7451_011855 [Penicillium sp. IBT 35674x]
MRFSTTLVSAALLAVAQAGVPAVSLEFQSWESCDIGAPARGEPKSKANLVATSVTCEKTTVNRDWSIDHYSFKAYLATKESVFCSGIHVWNNADCSGDDDYFMPLSGEPVVQGVCLPDFLDPGFVSFKLECGYPGIHGAELGAGGEGGEGGDADDNDSGF